jgi:hypothetical protein
MDRLCWSAPCRDCKKVCRHGRSALFEFLRGCLGKDESALSYAEIARLNLTEAAVKMAVCVCARYRNPRAEIADTVASPEEIERKSATCFRLLGRG